MVVICHWRCPLTIRTYALLHVVGIFTTTVPGFDRYEYLDTCLRLHISKTIITSSEVAAVPLTRKTRPTKIWGQLLLDLFETKNEHNQNSFFCTFVELSLISQNTCSRLCTKVQAALRELPEKPLGDLGIPVLHGFSSPTVETRDGCIPATIMIKEMLTTK